MHHSRSPIVLFTLALPLWLAGCATAPPADPAPDRTAAETSAPAPPEAPGLQRLDADISDPEWFDKLLARETELPAARPLSAPDGTFQGRVRGNAAAPQQVQEGIHYLQIGIGTQAPVQCWAYSVPVDTASALEELSRALHDGTVTGRPLQDYEVDRLEMDQVDGRPRIRLDWLYTAPSGNGDELLLGLAKQVMMVVGDAHLYCLHNEPGYRATFLDLVTELGRSLRFPDLEAEAGEPFLREILRSRIGEQAVGLAVEAFFEEDGEVFYNSHHIQIIPVDASTLQYSDSYDLETATADGPLLDQLSISQEGGEIVTELEVAPSGDGTWSVTGTFEGKDLEAEFEADELGGSWAQRLALADLDRGMADRIELRQWSENGDPTRPTVLVLEAQPEDPRRVRLRIPDAGLDLDVTTDDDGQPVRMTMAMAGRELVVEVVHAEGRVADGPVPTAP